MSPEQLMHKAAQDALVMCAGILGQYDWPAFREAIGRSETIGFMFMTPPAYQFGAERTAVLKEMAGHADALVRELGELRRIVERQEPAIADLESRGVRVREPAGAGS